MRKFEFQKSYEEIEIAGEIYSIDISDKKLKEHKIAINHFQKDAKNINEIDTEELPAEEEEKVFEDLKEVVKSIINQFLGEGSFDKLYAASGESLMNMIDLVYELGSILEEKSESRFQEKREKYTNLKNKE